MCCFSGKVTVANTRIFARLVGDGRQYLVYEMRFETRSEVAMILPLPVPRATSEAAVQFINFDSYPRFFNDLDYAFPITLSLDRSAVTAAARAPLRVVSVGSFEASFVPSQSEFQRLDARFRLPDKVWRKLPLYQDYGFAVFKLKPEATTVHPMAFAFPTREPERLFFPTVHIHDGAVHRKAEFNHSLYCQSAQEPRAGQDWLCSTESLTTVAEKSQGILDPAQSCYKLSLQGTYQNRDIWISDGDIWIPQKSGGTLWDRFVGWFSF